MRLASANTIIMLDAAKIAQHHDGVETQQEFLDRLLAAGATQTSIGKVLGIAQSNANTFFKPGANGKLRQLKLDEAVKLAEAFGLNEAPQRPVAPLQVHPETIEPILDALLPLAPRGQMTDQSLRALSQVLAYALEHLGDQLSSPANPGAGVVAARAAIARFDERGAA